jgi:hypothetical protein
MKRRGQAALEFLTTYGWAIMVVLLMIGALSYFGVLNPYNVLPVKCVFPAGMSCQDHIVIVDATDDSVYDLRFELENSFGETMQFSAITVTEGNTVLSNCEAEDGTGTGVAFPVNVRSGATQHFQCDDAAPNPGADEPIRLAVELTYRPVQGSYNRTAQGEIVTKVEP